MNGMKKTANFSQRHVTAYDDILVPNDGAGPARECLVRGSMVTSSNRTYVHTMVEALGTYICIL